MKIITLIPAYNPSKDIIDLVRQLSLSEFEKIIIVNDGSNELYEQIFINLSLIEKVTVLKHAVNLGKGAALKTGLNHAFCTYKIIEGVVTLDADGQHLIDDVIKIGQTLKNHPNSLILGVRSFDNKVPLRSKIGNDLTKYLFRFFIGLKLKDTQSGLRGIPANFILQLLKIKSDGYEFELDMLLSCKHSNREIIEVNIKTVYLDENISSHFNPIIDSMKIYFILFRFSLSSVATAVIDYSIFSFLFFFGFGLIVSQIGARSVALLFNYLLVKNLVFISGQKHSTTFPKYISLVIFSGTISYLAINAMTNTFPIHVLQAKIVAELIIFLVNFTIQRDFIFTSRHEKKTTDWITYYKKPYKTASITRIITTKVLIRLIKNFTPMENKSLLIGELGGANSCFLIEIKNKIKPKEYHIFDNNELGLFKLKKRIEHDKSTYIYNKDILKLDIKMDLDIVFSVGLIEHFTVENTKKVIQAHLNLLKQGGVAIISFPTPTLLYKATRFISEMLKLWIFYDERPIHIKEVTNILESHGKILHHEIIWPIFLTQGVVVFKKS